MEFDLIATVLLTIVVIAVGIAIVSYMGLSVQSAVPQEAKGIYDKFVSVLLQRSPYNVCESYDGQKLSIQDFQVFLQAAYNGQCGTSHTHVIMSFSVSKDDFVKLASLSGIGANGVLIFYNMSLDQPLGIGAIIVKGNPGYYPLKVDDTIEVWSAGAPRPDLFIKQTQKGCDPYDDVCDASCLFKNVCDPVCDDGKKHDIPCNLACIDIDKNGIINATDAGGRIGSNKCNPDCYSNITNPQRAYDPGCVWKYKGQNDDICDPNSNGVSDGICDPDCVNSKNICDPDCDGTVSAGNPYGIYDKKCFVCDESCNGYCSPSCNKNAAPGDFGFDPDCYKKTHPSYWCSGDGLCDTNKGENCGNSADCPGGSITCGDYNPTNACCPEANDTDQYGCSPTVNQQEGSSCTCGTQCAQGLTCDSTSHCCPEGKTWNGTACEFRYTFTMLFIQYNGNIPDFQAKAESAKDYFVSHTPLSKCPGKVRAIAVTDKVCNGPDQSGICSSNADQVAQNTWDTVRNCVESWGYGNVYTKIYAINPGTRLCDGIGGYTDIHYDISIDPSGGIETVASHESGHMFGLCDEDYGGGSCSGCSTGYCNGGGTQCSGGTYCCPNFAEGPSIMCSDSGYICGRSCTDSGNFNTRSYQHLEIELNQYCK